MREVSSTFPVVGTDRLDRYDSILLIKYFVKTPEVHLELLSSPLKFYQVRLTNLTPISPTNEDVYSSPELRSNPQPPIQVRLGPEFQPLPVPFHAGLLTFEAARWIPIPFRTCKSKHVWHERKLTCIPFLSICSLSMTSIFVFLLFIDFPDLIFTHDLNRHPFSCYSPRVTSSGS